MSEGPGEEPLALYRWHDRAVMGAALLAFAAGVGQFGAVAALGSVARAFGHLGSSESISAQAGLSGTELGAGLAVIRLASLGSLPLVGLADRVGRRRVLLATCAMGLALTVVAAASPTYWSFVVLFALGRPLLSATNGVAQVMAAEHTAAAERAKAVAAIAAGYAIGAGLTAVVHSLAASTLGFRGILALSALPLLALPALRAWVVEPARFKVARQEHALATPVLGPVGRAFRRRLLVVMVVVFALGVITGPADGLLFLYAQNVEHQSGWVTSLMVVAAGLCGLGGLLLGRYLADRAGRRPTIGGTIVVMAALGVLTYSGPKPALVVGYIAGVGAAATFAPAAGSLVNELFPTSVRASVAGWQVAVGVLGAVVGLVAFGAVADVGNRFGLGALATFAPVAPAALLLLCVPETKGRELEATSGAARPSDLAAPPAAG